MDRRAVFTILSFFILILATVAAIAYNKGYRPDFQKTGPAVEATGILVATSTPDGAQVLLNNKLTTATNNTLNLQEGDYNVKIVKEGYIPWEKNLKIKNGVVTETLARLFPAAPDLRAETTTGALLPTLSPDGTRLVYSIASGSAGKRGVWVMDLNERPLMSQAQSRQIAQDLTGSTFTWSPDSKQILATTPNKLSFLLDADRLNPALQEVTGTLDTLLENWNKDSKSRESEIISTVPKELINELAKMKIIAWSPDETKILYSASQSATLPAILEKPLLGSSTQPEERQLKDGSIYVYDVKEDKNFLIVNQPVKAQTGKNKTPAKPAPETSPSAEMQIETMGLSQRAQPIRWFPDSRHLIMVEEGDISILEYDNTNKDLIYSGPFENSFVYPWPNSSKLIILTTYNRPAGMESNLYSISLK